MQWDLVQLRQFVATAEAGSMSAASRQLGKAQSAVSTAIAMLEADVGLALFDRSKYRACLTEAGELLLQEAREVLRQAQSFDQRAQSLSRAGEAKLSIALDEALPYEPIARILREFSSQFPHQELTLLNGTAAEVAEYVEKERAQVAVQIIRGPLPQGFEQCPIGHLHQGAFACEGHPLVRFAVSRGDLAQYRQLLMHTDGVEETAYSPRVWRADSCYSLAEMVADDMGWAVLPLSVIEYESNYKRLQQIDCPTLELPPLNVRMIWIEGTKPGKMSHWIRTRLHALLAEDSSTRRSRPLKQPRPNANGRRRRTTPSAG